MLYRSGQSNFHIKETESSSEIFYYSTAEARESLKANRTNNNNNNKKKKKKKQKGSHTFFFVFSIEGFLLLYCSNCILQSSIHHIRFLSCCFEVYVYASWKLQCRIRLDIYIYSYCIDCFVSQSFATGRNIFTNKKARICTDCIRKFHNLPKVEEFLSVEGKIWGFVYLRFSVFPREFHQHGTTAAPPSVVVTEVVTAQSSIAL